MNPTCRARQAASFECFRVPSDSPATRTSPRVAWSMPPIRFKSVDFPEPLGPMSARNSPRFTSRLIPASTGISILSRR